MLGKKEDTLEQTNADHELFTKAISKQTIGRDSLIQELIESFIVKPTEPSPVVLCGGPGLGKTSVLALLAQKCITLPDQWNIISHFVGAVPRSSNLYKLLIRLLYKLNDLSEIPTSLDEASVLVRKVLGNSKTKRSIIIVDAVDQLDDYRRLLTLGLWIPSKLSPSVRLIVSLSSESSYFEDVDNNWTLLQLQPLDRKTKQEVLGSGSANHNVWLDRGQMELLLNKQGSDNPMWLSLALSELKISRNFKEITKKICSIPNGLAELENSFFGRLEQESNSAQLVAALCLVECSVQGLLKRELQELLADSALLPLEPMENFKYSEHDELENHLTITQLNLICDKLSSFIRSFGASSECRINIYHESLRIAVRSRYYCDSQSKKQPVEGVERWFRQKLVNYFGKKCQNLERQIEEFPTHAWKIGDVDGLKEFLCDWAVFEAMSETEFIDAWQRIDFSGQSNATLEEINTTLKKDYNSSLTERMKRVVRIFCQNGSYDAAFELNKQLIQSFHCFSENSSKNTDSLNRALCRSKTL